ncbi:unnamed protein product [Rhizoctonia solani]|uniref:Uncharacterized protein n=1 Tax=Rhizoctonia solani TaxID=456999 RepID=A0A8H3D9L7_9AGAM|nr:unnamed protein product [Rhizoctonia solani]
MHEHEEPLYLDFQSRFQAFDVDPIQKLVVLIEASYETPSYAQLHFRSLVHGKPHPLARLSTISIQLENSGPELVEEGASLEIQTEVAGNLLIAQCSWLDTKCDLYEVLILDWISGVLLGRICSRAICAPSVALLDKDHLALYSATSRCQSKHPDVVALLVYQVPSNALSCGDANGHFETAPYTSLVPSLVLEFPRVQDPIIIHWTSSMRTGQGIGQIVFDGLVEFSRSRVPILDVKISLSNPESDFGAGGSSLETTYIPTYQVYVSTCHIFELLDHKGPGKVTLSWNQWGPRATRWFDDERRRSPMAGSQCIQWKARRRYQKLSSIEFNPPSIEQYLTPFPGNSSPAHDARNRTKGTLSATHRRSIHEYRPLTPDMTRASDKVPVEMFGTDSKSVFHVGFEELVESCLPYRVTAPGSRVPSCLFWELKGHRLLGRQVEKADDPVMLPLLVYGLY